MRTYFPSEVCFSLADVILGSTNDVLELELEAANTPWAAMNTTMTTFSAYVDGFRWAIFRNVLTGVLHWDFVSHLLRLCVIAAQCVFSLVERAGSIHISSCCGWLVSTLREHIIGRTRI